MNGSHKYGFIWWGTAGCASRTTSVFLHQIGCDDFYNAHDDIRICVDGSHTHKQGIPKGYEDYPILCNIRNPYSRAVSSYLDVSLNPNEEYYKADLIDWVNEITNESNKTHNMDHYYIKEWEKIGRRPDYLIRMENMEEDLRNIPFLPKGENFDNSLHLIRVNMNKNQNPKDEYVGEFQKFQKYYTQEIADLVYEHHKEYFELGGYDKDSWKL